MPEGDPGGRRREMIDRGRTGDKIPGRDPSAAPLGSDEEASGTAAAGRFTSRDGTSLHGQQRARKLPGAVPHPNSGVLAPRSAMPWLVVWGFIILGAVAIVLAALET